MNKWLILGFLVYASLSIGIATWVYSDALNEELSADRVAGQVRLSEATNRFRGQMDVFRALVNIVAKEPKVVAALSGGNMRDIGIDLPLLGLTYGAREIDLVDASRRVSASSKAERIGSSFSRRLLRAAFNGRLGYSINLEEGVRLIRFSRGIKDGNRTIGAVVVSTEISAFEFEWPVTPEPIVFFDAEGISMAANRPDLLLLSNADDPEEAAFPLEAPRMVAGSTVWSFGSGKSDRVEVQELTKNIPQLEMAAQILLDTGNARQTAQLRLGLAITFLLVLGLIGAILLQQRRRIAMESRHSATLEERVEARTAELRAAQDELVEAANLAALGRLSAGLSHELNQPLGAILNFAENGRRLIECSRAPEAAQNLGKIAEQTHRITRIIGNLRAFARQEHMPVERIDIVGATKRALDLMRDDLSNSEIVLDARICEQPVYVMAGKVRLEQVILNLVSNASDAMQHSDKKILRVELATEGGQVQLSIRDTGEGIANPDRVFEPFYTTKELGSSKGLGMGLALCFGTITGFGGLLGCRNLEGGAEFTVTLPVVEETA